MGFQALLSVLIIFAIIRLFIQFHRKHITALLFIFSLVMWMGVFFLNLNNDIVQMIGHFLGINDGVRVIIYIAIFLLFYYVVVSAVKFHEIEKKIDLLVKKDAVDSFAKKYK
ncbi:MAG: DUF2304 domain-containing protein [Candidatus Omnitrophica bacterium]|jgi:hypothetical protein|nr:DUF2304 domain-containing protein [Candidatus Omnitrophota bacterium]